MKFLITGGAGFIGSNFCRYILENYDDEVVCLDKLTYAGNLDNLNLIKHNKNFKFVKGDICDKDLVFSLFEKEKFDYVVNFAAETHVDNSIENPELFIKTNVIGTSILMDACLKYNVTRFHQVSTDEVYGDLPLNNKELMFTEESKLNPSSPYSASKASADLLALSYYRTYGLDVTISRCSNNYGPYQNCEKLIPLVINHALNNKQIPVYGDGKNIRDWLYVMDHCSAIDIILKNAESGEVYNVGSNNEVANIEIVETILNCLDKPKSLVSYVKDRPGHDLRYALDCTKIKTKLNWNPTGNFNTLIVSTINWYKNNM